MLNRIKSWLGKGRPLSRRDLDADQAKRVAVAALLTEAAQQDGRLEAREEARIRALLASCFHLTDEDAAALAETGRAALNEAAGLFRFTRASVEGMTEAERERLVEMMWDVVHADGVVHDFEANLMRRMCGLLHVSDRASGMARQRAAARREGDV